MIEYKLSLASSGAVKALGYEDMLRFGYNKNCGVYRLRVTAAAFFAPVSAADAACASSSV